MNKDSRNILIGVVVLALIAGAYYFGTTSSPNLQKGGVADENYRTAYMVFCSSPSTNLENCEVKDTAVPTNFKIDTEKQQVFRWYDDELLGSNHVLLSECTIVDNDNWNCSDAGVKKGFNNGVYFEEQGAILNQAHGYLLAVTKAEWESVNKRLYPNN